MSERNSESFDDRAKLRTPLSRSTASQNEIPLNEWHEALFVRLTTEDGLVGWGETLASVAPEVAAAVVRSLLAPQLIGRDPVAIEGLWADLYGATLQQAKLQEANLPGAKLQEANLQEAKLQGAYLAGPSSTRPTSGRPTSGRPTSRKLILQKQKISPKAS